MSFLDKVARIRTELIGAASDMPGAQVVAAALPLMGIIPEPSWALPQMVDAIIEKMRRAAVAAQRKHLRRATSQPGMSVVLRAVPTLLPLGCWAAQS